MTKLRINPLVVADLKEIRNFIAEDNVEKAAETIEKIYEKFENIQLLPGMGADLSRRVSFRTDYKYAVWKDYVIIYKIREEYAKWDAVKKFSLTPAEAKEIPGCRCAQIIRGVMRTTECPLFRKVCSPDNPVGPCMVSGEGACAAAYQYG